MLLKISELLSRSRTSVEIENEVEYKRVTIRMNHQGVFLRDKVKGTNIGIKRQFLIKTGQFIMSGIDARNAAFGIVPEYLNGAIITNDFWTFDLNSELIDTDFFYLVSQTHNFLLACKKSSVGTTNRQRLQKDLFYNQILNIPPVPKQIEIVNFMKLNTDLEQLIAEADLNAKRIRQSILNKILEN